MPDVWLDVAVFLYGSKADAEAGRKAGGSGFVMAYPPETMPLILFKHFYFVTNKHNLTKGGYVVRVNVDPENFDVVETDPDKWVTHDHCDLAIYHFTEHVAKWNFAALEVGSVMTAEQFVEWHIGPGDTVYAMARLVGHDGLQRNTPVMQSGIVSMLPLEPMANEATGQQELSFMVEMHSRTGFSGAPVVVYRDPTHYPPDGDLTPGPFGTLLGVLRGHENVSAEVRRGGKPTGEIVMAGSGLATVVPAWNIHTLLERPDMADKREEVERQTYERLGPDPTNESVADFHEPGEFDRFTDLTRRLLQVPKDETAP